MVVPLFALVGEPGSSWERIGTDGRHAVRRGHHRWRARRFGHGLVPGQGGAQLRRARTRAVPPRARGRIAGAVLDPGLQRAGLLGQARAGRLPQEVRRRLDRPEHQTAVRPRLRGPRDRRLRRHRVHRAGPAGGRQALHVPRRPREVRPAAAPARPPARGPGVRGHQREARRLLGRPPRDPLRDGRQGHERRRPHGGRRQRPAHDARQPARVEDQGPGVRPVRPAHLVRRLRPQRGGHRGAARLHLHPLPAHLEQLGLADPDHRRHHEHRRGHAEGQLRQAQERPGQLLLGQRRHPARVRRGGADVRAAAARSRPRATTATP